MNTPEWVIPLLTAIGGAAVALIGREIIEWYKRPKLEINFEEREGQKPYIPDYNNWEVMHPAGETQRIKFLRLLVHNKGKRPAMDCEAKLEIVVDEARSTPNKVALHWSRRDPALYSDYGDRGIPISVDTRKIYAPINLNIEDKEPVDVLSLPYSFSTLPNTDPSPRFPKHIESVSFRQLQLNAKTNYFAKVTIYSSNAMPKSFKFKINWDGTIEGFDKAFTKD